MFHTSKSAHPHTIISFKNNENPKKITPEKTGSRERGGKGEREPDGGFVVTKPLPPTSYLAAIWPFILQKT